MKFLGVVKMGCLSNGTENLKIPKKPYNTDVEIYTGSGLGDIVSDDIRLSLVDSNEDLLTWYKFQSSDKVIYVCDRVLINNMSKSRLLDIISKNITLGGDKYNIRVPYIDEWNDLVRDSAVSGLPINTFTDTISNINKIKSNNVHNQFWNWIGIGTYVLKGKDIVGKGYYYPECEMVSEYDCGNMGFRPVLEEYVDYPIVQCETGRLEDTDKPFDFPYTVMSYVDNDNIHIREKFNGVVVKEYDTSESVMSNTMSLSNHWDSLQYGVQKIEIEARNKNGETTVKKATFATELPSFLDREGLNYFATSLWNSKIKPLVEEFSRKAGGLVLDSSRQYVGVATKFNTASVDNGVGLRHTINSTSTNMIRFNTTDLKLGKYGIMVRANVSDTSHSNNTFVVTAYRKTANGTRSALASRTFKASEFEGGYKCKYFAFDYATIKNDGDSIEIDIDSVSGATTNTFTLDYVLLSPMLPGIYSYS
ncbi:MAG: hypothetical protein ACRDDY_15515 [Clostridium sp.]|uniref:hypothetical protein n=1 Tax=Clostridium sp. TaxID=1506 RepID=UPI003EE44FB2